MKILHTSDWHLGRVLYGKKRYKEFEDFLDWLLKTVIDEKVDVLLVAGDIFDTSTPSNRAQELYYRFLHQLIDSPCRHAIFIAGNHDSASFLDAPKQLLEALHIHVVGKKRDPVDDEVLVLRDRQGAPELIVAAVPYLRDSDIRDAEAGESVEDKGKKLIEGIHRHYAEVAKLAEKTRQQWGEDIPIVGMGHLFTSGGRIVDGDGVRELYVGSLAHVDASRFPSCFDYLALGHLHVAQKVHGMETARYSGSPLPMGFGEAHQKKKVYLVEFEKRKASVESLDVPVSQELERIQGNWDVISARIRTLAATASKKWLEVIYDGDEVIGNLRERLEALVEDSPMEVLRIKNNRIIEQVMKRCHDDESLGELKADEVFRRCLEAHDVPETQRPGLIQAYQEVLQSLLEEDVRVQ
ncbi:MAG TPA: exonuclease SbcCD subunit D C-terminal domain-containing protein [Polyangiaceae bacterium]|jgi:exonuclease SbcD|nr:MAG: Nuclease SbcCD subunit D [Deltaproteobacteria bacterium ADurb.Bin207]HNS98225.1 exonuclease SbcCD subunit D C-terminal domain-containing protein [Polyangiaceae bacterium]HNZ23390.1 exonuclease SbcCD subunit D C-terminal domain-containing protein [Polyangiaceae bacterium]HOD22799.1 exonuclease SbcCD subunit D C-terminal domain-containing protein [Polyangiaceae bacterium]HOE49850.1 exonuclease SbcCD subunit D C-terminal domain-containing protein [Polyangiaceae bacterium]